MREQSGGKGYGRQSRRGKGFAAEFTVQRSGTGKCAQFEGEAAWIMPGNQP
jgi:hypothetical protein